MSDNLILWFFNTYGVFLLIFFVIFYFSQFQKNFKEVQRILLSVSSALIVSVVLKELFGSPRPFIFKDLDAKAGLTHFSSFPSAHSAMAFAAVTTLSRKQKLFGLIVLAMAILIALGRVISDVHYPEDVIAGIVIGVSIAIFFEQVIYNLKR